MATVHYITHENERSTVDVEEGMTLMEGAQLNMVPGIVAECGGMCACATCHCYIKSEWASKIPGMLDCEKKMLEKAVGLQGSSRLSCQIVMADDIEGIEVHIPANQG